MFRAGNGAEFSMTREDEESDPTILCSDGTEVQLSEEHEFLLDECGEEPAESSAEAEMGAADPCAEEESEALHDNVGLVPLRVIVLVMLLDAVLSKITRVESLKCV